MPQKKETLKEIRANLLTRGLTLAKASLKAGRLTAGQWLNGGADTNKPAWLAQVEVLVAQLGELKGTAMKVGQTLSMYGEHLLPKELNEVFKRLQQDSPPLAWESIERVLREEFGDERLQELDIEPLPVAAASIGQVHRATVRSTGQVLAIKVQYPGVDRAVDTDIKLIKFILGLSDLIPRGPRFDQLFEEIRTMFLQEVNYTQELSSAQQFSNWLADDPKYFVPQFFPEYSGPKVISSSFIEGARPDSPEVQALSQERRNRLGLAFLELYLRELFEFRRMQTDPHLGNYRIHIDPSGAEQDRLVLFDFGAVRDVPDDFLESYALLVEGGLNKDARIIEKGGRRLGLLKPEDPLQLVNDYVELCCLLTEPFQPEAFQNAVYDWGQTDLPKRVAAQASRIAVSYKLRAPPRELVFLDRKLGGVFIFMSVLGCVTDARPVVEAALQRYLKARALTSPNRG